MGAERKEKNLVAVPHALLTELATELANLKSEFADLKAEVQKEKDPKHRQRRALIGRAARRAGMLVTEWEKHCQATGHDPTKMDKRIPNHDAIGSRGGRPAKGSKPKGRRQLTDDEKKRAAEARNQTKLFDE